MSYPVIDSWTPWWTERTNKNRKCKLIASSQWHVMTNYRDPGHHIQNTPRMHSNYSKNNAGDSINAVCTQWCIVTTRRAVHSRSTLFTGIQNVWSAKRFSCMLELNADANRNLCFATNSIPELNTTHLWLCVLLFYFLCLMGWLQFWKQKYLWFNVPSSILCYFMQFCMILCHSMLPERYRYLWC